mmetsp:Transcript_76801/g.178143  ORF Transcript_76801/g.178143 Transcript_76801/m.178143 type:complete len:307 (-) Transcript_76801:228-1148(-)
MVCRWMASAPIVFTTDLSRPKAASPKALRGAGSASLSLSSAETITPESGAAGRPSRASAVDSCSPESRPVPEADSVSPESCAGLDVPTTFLNGINKGDIARRGRRSGELRRRKYILLANQPHIPSRIHSLGGEQEVGNLLMKLGGCAEGSEAFQAGANTPGPGTAGSAPSSSTTASAAASEAEESEVVIEGPLQQRHLLVFWRWRWYVLDRKELRMYWNEEASLLMPEKPLERRNIASLAVTPDLHFPSVLICADSKTGEPLSFLRAGPGLRWEEVAASTLWLRAFTTACRQTRLLRVAAEAETGC